MVHALLIGLGFVLRVASPAADAAVVLRAKVQFLHFGEF